jgi:hypothetical protein
MPTLCNEVTVDCDFTWITHLPSGVAFRVSCTREEHPGEPHVAEDLSGEVIAVSA